MKKVININFQGRVVPIEESAYEILKRYIESLRQFFSNEEGKDEIINDIESRIGELFGEQLKKGSACITDEDVQTIINSMGRPEDFEAEESNLQGQLGGKSRTNQSSTSSESYASSSYTRTERLYRDENNKLLGGVCAGLANHFGVDILVVRVLFVLFTLAFGFGIIAYLILWVAVPSTASTAIGSVRKRLFRDPENKLIGGVCGGLASYFGVNVWIPRILFLIPFLSFVTSWHSWGVFNFPNFINLSFSPGATILYIILWLIIPEAVTTADRLEMKGEKVNLNSIKNTIQKDMEGFGDRAKDFGKEVGDHASKIGTDIGRKGKQFGAEASQVVRKTGTSFGDVIAMIFKIFGYFIAAVVLLTIVGVLFSIGVLATGLLPYKPYFTDNGWQSVLAWGTYIFFIWVPVIGIITWIIRKIARIKRNSTAMRFSFIGMWILGWFCFIGLLASIVNDVSYHNSPVENSIQINNSSLNKLQVKYVNSDRYYFNSSFFNLEPFASIEDTIFFPNINLRVLKSDNDSFKITLLKLAYGSSKDQAEHAAENINFNINQKDSFLLLDRGIPITKTDKFRNQSVYITIYVPVGKRIFVDDGIGWGNNFHLGFNRNVDDWGWRSNNEGYDWSNNTEYIMTEDGLKKTHPDEIKNDDNNDDNLDDQHQEETPQQPATTDTTHYHYKPSSDSPSATLKKTEASIKAIRTSLNINEAGSAFLERFSL